MISTGEGIAEFGVRPIHRFINDMEQHIPSTAADDTKSSHLLAQQQWQGQAKTLHSFFAYGLIDKVFNHSYDHGSQDSLITSLSSTK